MTNNSLTTIFEIGLLPEQCFMVLTTENPIWLGDFALLDQPSPYMFGDFHNSHYHFIKMPDMFLRPGQTLRLCTGDGKDKTEDVDGQRVFTIYLSLLDYHFNEATHERGRFIQFQRCDYEEVKEGEDLMPPTDDDFDLSEGADLPF